MLFFLKTLCSRTKHLRRTKLKSCFDSNQCCISVQLNRHYKFIYIMLKHIYSGAIGAEMNWIKRTLKIKIKSVVCSS